MKTEPQKAHVFQPMAPQKDGRYYGVGGLAAFNLDPDIRLWGVSKADAEKIVQMLNENPSSALEIVEDAKGRIADEWLTDCGCRFESIFSNSVLLCETCAQLPCHTGDRQRSGGGNQSTKQGDNPC